MARIRTIKPEFFTSEDICALPPLTRLLYISLWCEADKDGRLEWKPRTWKLRYFPADDIDIDAAAAGLLASGLIVQYGEGLAYIPTFAKHQHINPRESASTLPDPKDFLRVSDASPRVDYAQVGREGKGREGKKETGSSTLAAPAADVAHVDSDLGECWSDETIAYLRCGSANTEKSVRGMMGQWLKRHEPGEVIATIRQAQASCAAQPLPWVNKALGNLIAERKAGTRPYVPRQPSGDPGGMLGAIVRMNRKAEVGHG